MNYSPQNQVDMLLQVFTVNGNLSLPPIFILPERMYKDITYKKKPGNKLTTIEGLLRFFISKEAKKLKITNSVIINKVMRTLLKEASSQDRRAYRNFSDAINLLIKSRSLS
ncbi:uncharacterized protein OCT59_006319 [Rhizophagus irregularis]|uniref:Uncharacterized protein n=1 Tax=Rhizophagus irregularis (strain DAOM 181602 / DAOM 197198 / MUCL 43194) TaxID=747089 RepID=U9UPT1_RHIID|nr:hypothetical protein OCT59_006319 [Rhizophagus irregularis]GBC18246.1 hypothetical protein RIR_jg1714.t1 [Rhizophagus irregularis DAOM 181602=DAOM 197198]CAG8516584.1 15798_t:CDS:1 [Rhizophagus irregularis]